MRFYTVKTIKKDSNSRIRVIWFIKVLVCALLTCCNTAITFAENNIVDNLQVIQHGQTQHSDNKLFRDLIQIDEQFLDIAETSLLIAKEEYSEIKIRDYVECIDWYARMIKARIMENDEPETIVNTINEFLFDELGFTYVQTGNLEDLYLNKVIDARKGNCIGLSILYLSIAERLKLPLFGVNVPEHIFIRYDDGEQRINIEMGHSGMSLPDTFYVTHSIERFDKKSVDSVAF